MMAGCDIENKELKLEKIGNLDPFIGKFLPGFKHLLEFDITSEFS